MSFSDLHSCTVPIIESSIDLFAFDNESKNDHPMCLLFDHGEPSIIFSAQISNLSVLVFVNVNAVGDYG